MRRESAAGCIPEATGRQPHQTHVFALLGSSVACGTSHALMRRRTWRAICARGKRPTSAPAQMPLALLWLWGAGRCWRLPVAGDGAVFAAHVRHTSQMCDSRTARRMRRRTWRATWCPRCGRRREWRSARCRGGSTPTTTATALSSLGWTSWSMRPRRHARSRRALADTTFIGMV